jgi:hypothetical protein
VSTTSPQLSSSKLGNGEKSDLRENPECYAVGRFFPYILYGTAGQSLYLSSPTTSLVANNSSACILLVLSRKILSQHTKNCCGSYLKKKISFLQKFAEFMQCPKHLRKLLLS